MRVKDGVGKEGTFLHVVPRLVKCHRCSEVKEVGEAFYFKDSALKWYFIYTLLNDSYECTFKLFDYHNLPAQKQPSRLAQLS